MSKNKKRSISDPNYPEDFWPKIITLFSIGAFIFWVMTSQNADTILDQFLFDPILRLFEMINKLLLPK